MREPLYQKVYDDLKNKISTGEIHVGEQLPTEKELTELYQVSRITAQKAVNLLADDGIVDRRSGVGTFVVDTNNVQLPKQFIGLILPGITDSYGRQLLESIIAEAEKQNFQLVLKFSSESQHREKALLDELISMPIDGLLIDPVQRNFYDANLIKLIYDGFPTVIIDKELEGIDSLFVGSDHYTGALQLAEEVIARGHRNVALIGYHDIANSTLARRVDAFKAAFQQNGHPLPAQRIAHLVQTSYASRDATLQRQDVDAVKALIQTEHPTCLVALDAYIGGLVRQALFELSLRIPEDISLIGFDSDNTSFLAANYTYLQQNETAVGKSSVELLTKAIKGETIRARRQLVATEIQHLGSVHQL